MPSAVCSPSNASTTILPAMFALLQAIVHERGAKIKQA